MYRHSRDEGFGAEVKRRILLGTYALSAGYYDAYYLKAQQVRRLLAEEYLRAFAEVDAIVTPTAPTAAFKLGEKTGDPLAMYLADIYTVTASLAGICGVTVPCGDNQGRLAGGDAGAGRASERGHGLPRGAGGGGGGALGVSDMNEGSKIAVVVMAAMLAAVPVTQAAPRKGHTVVLGAVVKRPYSKAGDPAGAAAGENELKVRALLVDGVVKEWTTGEAHDVTDRSFVVRRVIKLNDTLPGDNTIPSEKPAAAGDKSGVAGKPGPSDKPALNMSQDHWVWQRGPWLLVDRVTGHIAILKLPDYDPGVSQASWFRDYAAYCGVTVSGKSLYAVVAQVAARKPLLAKKLAAFDPNNHPDPVCGAPEWQREPLRVTFHSTGKDAVSFDIVPGSAVLVEDAGDEAETPAPATEAKPK